MIRALMASKAPHPVIVKLKAWRTVHGLSQSQAVRVLVDAGLPIKIGTLQQWERARTSPQAVTSAALERFLSEQHETSTSQRAPAPIILRLKSWREANSLSQAEAVRILASAGVPAKLPTLQQWEIGRRSPPAITTAALQRFLDEHPTIDWRSPSH